MLGRIRSLAAASGSRPPAEVADRATKSLEELMSSFPPMVVLRPNPADNDEVMAPVYEAVEQELREAGML